MGWERELKRQERKNNRNQGGFVTSVRDGIGQIVFFAGGVTFMGIMMFALVGILSGEMPGRSETNTVQREQPRYELNSGPSDEVLAERAVNVFLKLNYTGTTKSNCRHFTNSHGVRIVTCRVTGPSQMGTTISKKMNFNIEQTPAGMRVHSVW